MAWVSGSISDLSDEAHVKVLLQQRYFSAELRPLSSHRETDLGIQFFNYLPKFSDFHYVIFIRRRNIRLTFPVETRSIDSIVIMLIIEFSAVNDTDIPNGFFCANSVGREEVGV